MDPKNDLIRIMFPIGFPYLLVVTNNVDLHIWQSCGSPYLLIAGNRKSPHLLLKPYQSTYMVVKTIQILIFIATSSKHPEGVLGYNPPIPKTPGEVVWRTYTIEDVQAVFPQNHLEKISHFWKISSLSQLYEGYNLVIWQFAVEYGPVDTVSFPINNMVIFHTYVAVHQRLYHQIPWNPRKSHQTSMKFHKTPLKTY